MDETPQCERQPASSKRSSVMSCVTNSDSSNANNSGPCPSPRLEIAEAVVCEEPVRSRQRRTGVAFDMYEAETEMDWDCFLLENALFHTSVPPGTLAVLLHSDPSGQRWRTKTSLHPSVEENDMDHLVKVFEDGEEHFNLFGRSWSVEHRDEACIQAAITTNERGVLVGLLKDTICVIFANFEEEFSLFLGDELRKRAHTIQKMVAAPLNPYTQL
eukprot:Platyproteum_vivax@DN3668_c0_g1_i1.p1